MTRNAWAGQALSSAGDRHPHTHCRGRSGADAADTVDYQVLGVQGELLSGERGLPLPPESMKAVPGVVHIRDDEIRGADIKVAYTWVKLDLPGARPALVQVAETLDRRSVLATEIVKGDTIP